MKLPSRRFLIAPEVDAAGERIFRVYELVPIHVNDEPKYAFRACAANASESVLREGIKHVHGIEEPVDGYHVNAEPQMTIVLPPGDGTLQPSPQRMQ